MGIKRYRDGGGESSACEAKEDDFALLQYGRRQTLVAGVARSQFLRPRPRRGQASAPLRSPYGHNTGLATSFRYMLRRMKEDQLVEDGANASKHIIGQFHLAATGSSIDETSVGHV